jgi:DNA mismatch endonuclease (patch repair protein)
MPITRSENMRLIKSKDTQPELELRRLLRQLGHGGYRLHRTDIPGRPDVAYVGRRKAIFMHGCFWHGHECKRGARAPKSNTSYWALKIQRNRLRDQLVLSQLQAAGWSVLVVWECEICQPSVLSPKLLTFLKLAT